MLKLFDPNVTNEEIDAVKQVLLSHHWASGAGLEMVTSFEEELSSYIGCKTVVTVNSGTAALHLALSLTSSEDMDVLVPSLSFVSTAHAVRYNRAKVVFVDVDPQTLCMDPGDLEIKIRSDKAIAIVPVHFGGMPCDIYQLNKIAKAHDLNIVDDAAHACGALYRGKHIGNMGNMTCFSFHPVKNLSMPSGGAIALNSSSWKRDRSKLLSLRWCGIDKRVGTTYDVTSISPNYYLNEISAAIGRVQLRKLDTLNRRRKDIANRYHNELNIEQKMPYSDDCAYHLYWIMSENRKHMIKHMNDKGIEVGTHYRPIHTMTAYKEKSAPAMPVTEKVGGQIITIPIHSNLNEDDVSYIIESINKFA